MVKGIWKKTNMMQEDMVMAACRSITLDVNEGEVRTLQGLKTL